MKLLVRIGLIFAVLFSITTTAVAQQTTSITLYYNGAQAQGCCNVCGTDYWCVNNNPFGGCGTPNPTWSLNFNNPVPTGNIITAVSATFYVADCDATSMTASINSTSIGAAPIGGSCSCGTCNGRTASRTFGCSGITGYNYGGSNSLTVSPNGSVCIQRVTLTFTYIQPTPQPAAGNNGPICAGQNLQLQASSIAGASYVWSGPNGFSSTQQNPVISGATAANAGQYQVTASIDGCPGISGTTTVSVLSTPSGPTVSNNGPLCVGSNLQLTASPITGATYTWSGPNGFSSSSQNPTISNVSPTNGGTYTVYATTNGCVSSTSSTTVTVSPPPASPAAGNNSPACAGANVNLTAATIPGATYSWTGPNGYTSSQQNPTISGIALNQAGTYSVSATVGGCQGSASSTVVNVLNAPAAPTVSNNTPICAGQTINLYGGNVSGAVYSWTGPNGFTSSSQNPVRANANASMAGTYTLIVTVAGCPSPPSTTTVFVGDAVTPPTASSNTPICTGGTLNLSTGTYPGATYQWTGPGGFSSTSQNPTLPNVTTTNQGTYSVVVNFGSCGSAIGSTSVTVNANPATPTAGSNSPLCEGSTLNLTAATISGATYSWTGPNGFSSSSQNPSVSNITTLDAGTYTVTATKNGCTSTSTVTVTVGSIPSTPTAANNGPLCVGQPLNLTAATVSGVTYSWTGPNGYSSAQQNPTIASVAANQAGTYTVTATLGNCASASSSTTVVVNTIPASPTVNNNSPICAGTDLNLTASNVSGATYTWTGPNNYSSTSQNPTIPAATTNDAGTYSVYTTINGCSSNAVPTTVTVNSIPSSPIAGSNSPICAGQTINLTATSVSGATYLWIGPNGFASPLQNPTISNATTAASGQYSVTATVNGCTSSSGTSQQGVVNVVVTPIPAAPGAGSNTPVCEGDTINLGAGTISGATYSWTGPNSFTSSQQYPQIINASNANAGTYSVTASVNGCTGSSSSTSVTIRPTPAAPTASNNGPVCVGQTLQLSSSTVAGASYTWSGPNNFVAGQQNPQVVNVTAAAAGTYTLYATVNGCPSANATTTVTVNSPPSAPTASNNGPLCVGDNLQLNATTISGASYSWTGPNGFTSSLQNPTITGVTALAAGTYNVTATVGGCSSSAATTSLTIASNVSTPSVGNNGPLCETDDLNLTSSSVSGGTYSWTGPNGFTSSSQNPTVPFTSTADAGQYTLVVNIGNCSSTPVSTTVVINPAPSVSFSDPGDYCINDAPVDLSAFVTPSGGIFTGNGINGNMFNPAAAGGGFHNVSYVYTNLSTGCSSNAFQGITVSSPPNASISGLAANYCIGDANVTLTGTPAGGTFSGPGMNSDVFWPNTAGSGTHTISYSFTDSVGCVSAVSQPTVVSDTTIIGFSGLNSAYCISNPTVTVTGIPSGGTFLGPGMNGTTFDPLGAGPGTHTITYLYTNNNNCSSSYQQQVVVNDLPSISINDLEANYCINSGPQVFTGSPAPGTCSGTGVSGCTFYPSIAGLGTHSVSYTHTDSNGCTSSTFQSVTVTTQPNVDFTGLSTQACVNGGNDTLVGTPSGGTFSGPGVTSNVFDPAAAGTGQHSITYTFDDGNCAGNATYLTTVNAAPEPTATASGATTFCAGDSVNLTTGTYNSYAWSNSGAGQSITVMQAGTYTVTVTDANGCQGVSNDITVTVNPAPLATITPNGPTSFCDGDSVTLTASAGASFMWSNGATDQSIVLDESGSVYVTVTDTNGCFATSATTNVTVTSGVPVVTTNSSLSFCRGDSVVLTASAGTAYMWSNGATDQSITVFGSDTLTVSVTGSGGCDGTSDEVIVIMHDLPTPVVTVNLDSVVTGQGYQGYQWYVNGGAISGANNYFHIYAQDGQYQVNVTDTNGCSATSDSVLVIIIGTTEQGTYNITINPNPTLGEFVVNATFEGGNDYTIEIIDLNGKMIIPKAITGNGNSFTQRFDIQSLAKGVYLLKVTAGGEQIVKKIIKQ